MPACRLSWHRRGLRAPLPSPSHMLVAVGVTKLPRAWQANVRVVQAAGAYPTVATMVQDMEARRDLTENLVARVLARLCL
jgi:hypothetical protein